MIIIAAHFPQWVPDKAGPPTFPHGRVVSVPTGQQGGEPVYTVAAFSVRCSGTL